ncbi:hypothetical protein J7E50_23005, partial [Pedobacter sp. ISL-68]|uniref:hypothetical protein n=1 Tax=Pedobacter sp. ISL-68 TaxID=2819165 RepID=UPI001BE9E175
SRSVPDLKKKPLDDESRGFLGLKAFYSLCLSCFHHQGVKMVKGLFQYDLLDVLNPLVVKGIVTAVISAIKGVRFCSRRLR